MNIVGYALGVASGVTLKQVLEAKSQGLPDGPVSTELKSASGQIEKLYKAQNDATLSKTMNSLVSSAYKPATKF